MSATGKPQPKGSIAQAVDPKQALTMTMALIEGIILGITLAFLVGPAFISLVQTSIHRGRVAGLQFAIGISLSDITLVALSYFGLLQIFETGRQYHALGIIGGCILIAFGVVTFTRKYTVPKPVQLNVRVKTGRFFKYLSKWFFMNILNPFLLLFWVGVMGVVSARYNIPSREIHLFFAATISTVFLTDMVKVFISRKIKKFLSIHLLTLLNRIVGSLLILFGVVLIVRVLILT